MRRDALVVGGCIDVAGLGATPGPPPAARGRHRAAGAAGLAPPTAPPEPPLLLPPVAAPLVPPFGVPPAVVPPLGAPPAPAAPPVPEADSFSSATVPCRPDSFGVLISELPDVQYEYSSVSSVSVRCRRAV